MKFTTQFPFLMIDLYFEIYLLKGRSGIFFFAQNYKIIIVKLSSLDYLDIRLVSSSALKFLTSLTEVLFMPLPLMPYFISFNLLHDASDSFFCSLHSLANFVIVEAVPNVNPILRSFSSVESRKTHNW